MAPARSRAARTTGIFTSQLLSSRSDSRARGFPWHRRSLGGYRTHSPRAHPVGATHRVESRCGNALRPPGSSHLSFLTKEEAQTHVLS